jgi:putative sugar O-methyltransferase
MKLSHIARRLAYHFSSPKRMVKFVRVASRFGIETADQYSHYYLSKYVTGSKLEQHYLKQFRKWVKEFNRHENKMSDFWTALAARCEREMIGKGLTGFRSGYYRKIFAFDGKKNEIRKYYQTLKKKDKFKALEKVEEPLIGKPPFMRIDGKPVSWDILQSADEFTTIMDFAGYKPTDKKTILEIGAGYGRLPYMFLGMMPNAKYIIVDIPTTLITAYYFLTRAYGKDITKRVKFLLPHQIKTVKKGEVDLFINIDSFQEMTPEIVKGYFEEMSRIGGEYLYTKNKEVEDNFVDDIAFRIDDYPIQDNMRLVRKGTWDVRPYMKELYIRFKK